MQFQQVSGMELAEVRDTSCSAATACIANCLAGTTSTNEEVSGTITIPEIAHDTEEGAPHEAAALYLSSEKARRQLDWQALWPFERAAGETAAWYRCVAEGRAPLEITREQIRAYMRERAASKGQPAASVS